VKIDFESAREVISARFGALAKLGDSVLLAIGPQSDLALGLEIGGGGREEVAWQSMVAHASGAAASARPPLSFELDGKPWARPPGYHVFHGHRGSGYWSGALIAPSPDRDTPSPDRPRARVEVLINIEGFEVSISTFSSIQETREGLPEHVPHMLPPPRATRPVWCPPLGASLRVSSKFHPCYWEALRDAGAALEALYAKSAPSWLELLRLGAREETH
jgi:hypothetical protein